MQEIYIEDTGSGYPLVLIHGFLGSSEMWEPQINYLSKYFRVITPNLPGFGKSKTIKSVDSIYLMANSVIEHLNKKKIEKFYLLGHSMGGMIAQEITTQLGNRITKLICYGTGPIGDIPGRFETMDESREKLKKNGLEITAYRIAKTWFVEEDKSKYFYLCDNAGKATSVEAVDNALIAMKNWNGIENLQNIKSKTLIIWGDQDRAYNFSQVDTLNKNIPNCDIVIFKDCSHNVHLEKPDKFNEIVKNFLES